MSSWKIFCTGVGGQGTLLATYLIGEAALKAGLPVMVSEIHGMAQRGGVVESAVVMGDRKSPIISDGEADILLAFEPSEAMRALRKCNSETLVISNIVPLIPFTVSSGKESYPEVDKLLDSIRNQVRRFIGFNALELARKAGSELSQNMVILGVLFKHGGLPIDAEIMRDMIRTKTKKAFLDVNLRAFELGYSL